MRKTTYIHHTTKLRARLCGNAVLYKKNNDILAERFIGPDILHILVIKVYKCVV
jgi:hypothetical protein